MKEIISRKKEGKKNVGKKKKACMIRRKRNRERDADHLLQ